MTRTLRFALEKTFFVWLGIAALYSVYFALVARHQPFSVSESRVYEIVRQYAEQPFPPTIGLIRQTPDWGHIGYYVVMGVVFGMAKGAELWLKGAQLFLFLLALFLFTRLGAIATYRNRLSPVWVSLATMFLAVNPYAWTVAFSLGHIALLLVCLFCAMLFFEREELGITAAFLSVGILVDWYPLLLAVAFALTRIMGESSRLVRPERVIALLSPFVVAAFLYAAWGGPVPQGDARQWYEDFLARSPKIRLDQLFYMFALLPVYGIYSISWGLKARSRALLVGAIAAGLSVPFYFLFPIVAERWEHILTGNDVALGLIDQAAIFVAGPYKNLVLFVPWLAGIFLFYQLVLMDVLDRTRWMRYFVIAFFCVQPFVIGADDLHFFIIAPVLFLLTLSEALVGEEGKLA